MSQDRLNTMRDDWADLPCALLSGQPLPTEKQFFVLYGLTLDKAQLLAFVDAVNQNFLLYDAWVSEQYVAVILCGQFNRNVQRLAYDLRLDIAPLSAIPQLEKPGLLVMDMDSTAIQIECIDEIAKLAGTGEEVSAITEQAMRGELDFEQSLRRRVSTLKGAPERILQQVRSRLPLMSGLARTLHILQQHGWRTAIASGGFTYFADYLQQRFKLDKAVSNQLEVIDGVLTGKVVGQVVDAAYKATTLNHLCQIFSIDKQNTIAIGDGANDLPMLAESGYGVAFHAKPKVQQRAKIVINFADLTALLLLLEANKRFQQLVL